MACIAKLNFLFFVCTKKICKKYSGDDQKIRQRKIKCNLYISLMVYSCSYKHFLDLYYFTMDHFSWFYFEMSKKQTKIVIYDDSLETLLFCSYLVVYDQRNSIKNMKWSTTIERRRKNIVAFPIDENTYRSLHSLIDAVTWIWILNLFTWNGNIRSTIWKKKSNFISLRNHSHIFHVSFFILMIFVNFI